MWAVLSVIYLLASLIAIALCIKYRGIYREQTSIFILDLLFCLFFGPLALGFWIVLRCQGRI